MNQGKYIFSQICDFLPKNQFDWFVKKYQGNLIAHNDNDNTNLDAKVQQKCNTAKSDVNKLNVF